MYLYQKLKYNKIDLEKLEDVINNIKPLFVVFDTETTGLDFMEDKPFLVTVSFANYYTIFTPEKENMEKLYKAVTNTPYFFAHNAKYDWHMTYNNDTPMPEEIHLADSTIVARLTSFADDESSISLESLGTAYVDASAKFAGNVIKKLIKEMNGVRVRDVKIKLKNILPKGVLLGVVWEAYNKRVQFVESEYDEYFDFIDANYSKPTYLDVYLEHRELMESYAIDDVVILNEYLKKAMPILEKTSGLDGVFEQECKLLRVVGELERVGVKANTAYLLESRDKVLAYVTSMYNELEQITGKKFTSGQHDVIKEIMEKKYGISMETCDKKILLKIKHADDVPEEASKVAGYIKELRSLDKALSTYIEGMLNRIRKGRIHTDIKNYGTVTGRVSSNLQQQPKEGINDREGNELFHPRKIFESDDDFFTYYFDYSQMELRVQAHYVLSLTDETSTLARAFMPHNCVNKKTGKIFEYKKDNINDEWLLENGELWEPIDVHTETTLKAFPDIDVNDPDFSHFRSLGKRCNFLKNYAGGAKRIAESLDIPFTLAVTLDKAYYDAFPEVKKYYQSYINKSLYKYGYVANLYGRRYYLQNSANYYKAFNYVVQGSCADILKEKQIKIHELFKFIGAKSRMLLPIHDELMIAIYKDELYLIPIIKSILDDIDLNVPMLCDVETTNTNWAEKYEVVI